MIKGLARTKRQHWNVTIQGQIWKKEGSKGEFRSSKSYDNNIIHNVISNLLLQQSSMHKLPGTFSEMSGPKRLRPEIPDMITLGTD